MIKRPFDLPIMTNYDKFLSLVADPVQRKILSDGLKQADIPEPAQRYLKALGEGQIDDELYENFLPHEEVAAQEPEAAEQEENEETEEGSAIGEAGEANSTYQGPLLAQELESV